VTGPFGLEYGLTCRHDANRGSLDLVPSLGGVWSSNGWVARAAVSYVSAESELAYAAELNVPLTDALHVVGAASFDPSRSDVVERGWEGTLTDAVPIFVTDGHSANGRAAVGLVHETDGLRAMIELAGGFAQGAVVPLGQLAPATVPGGERELRHHGARMGVQLAGTGTAVEVAYRRLAAASPSAEPSSAERAVELRVAQDLPVFNRHGDWRLLGAVRFGAIENAALSRWEGEVGSDAPIVALDRRLSAGISFGF
jgi:hypothetical protein